MPPSTLVRDATPSAGDGGDVRDGRSHDRTIRVVIADDHALFREALRTLLEHDSAMRVVGEAADGGDAVKLARELTPDVVLLDLRMPGTSGLEALRALSRLTPPVRTLVLTAEVDDADVLEALQLGAQGVVMKHATAELLFKSIRTVMAGQYWVGRECVADLIGRMRETRPAPVPESPTFGLTPRETDIVAAVVDGCSNNDIAKHLSISAKTVKHHLTNIFDKLGVGNRLELALFAVQHRFNDRRFH